MFPTRWLRGTTRTPQHGRARTRPRFRPTVEGLEGRDVPSTLTVTTASALVWVVFHFAPAAVIYVAPFPAAATLIIYFRLLGRLGWCCTRAFAE